jgi:hypothetical protein
MTANTTPTWVVELQAGIAAELSEDYRLKACYQFDEKFLYVTFPTIPFMQLDIKKGINRAVSKYDGDMSQDPTTKLLTLTFLNPEIKNSAILPPPAPVQTVTVSQTPSYQTTIQGDSNTTKNKQNEVKNNMLNLDDYLKDSGLWVSPKNTNIGDIFQILAMPYEHESTFEGKPQKQVVIDVKRKDTETSMKFRLNKDNLRILINNFGGGNGSTWPGKQIRILDKKPSQKGISLVVSPA